MKQFFIAALLLLSFSATKAQTSNFDSTSFYANSNAIYGNLDKTKITTGLLREYGIDFINQDNYNGQTLHDSNWVNLTDWRVLYASLYSQQISSVSNMVYLDSINNRLNRFSTSNLPIAFVGLDYYFQGLDTNAIIRNLIKIVKGKLYDVTTPPVAVASNTINTAATNIVQIKPTPYIKYNAFAFATTQQKIFTGSNTFIFRPELFYNNTGKTISQLQISPFGNGVYQTVYFNTAFTINYPDTGLIPIAIKLIYTDGSMSYSHTKLAVYPSNNLARYSQFRPFTNIPITATKPYLGILGQGDITIQLSVNNTTGQIRKPLIVVEGFDPDGGYRFSPDYLDNLNNDFNTNPPQTTTLNNGLDDVNSYDLIFLNYANGTDFIQRNAFLLEEVIARVNNLKTTFNGVRQQNVITGMSMGGLVAKYALRDMELTNIPHETRLFISHDAPHWGANVPVGYQALVQHIGGWKIINVSINNPLNISYQDLFPDAANARNLFNTPAARQMLIQRYALLGDNLYPVNTDHINFMNEINAMGWPTQCRNITLANGSCNGATQFPAGSQLLSIYGSKSLGTYFGGLWRSLVLTLGGTFGAGFVAGGTGGTIPINYGALAVQFPLSIITTKGSFYFDFAAWATPNGGSAQVYQGDMYIKRQLFWGLFNSTSYIIKCHANATAGMLALDNAPGGVYDVNQFGLDVNGINNQLHSTLGNWINAAVLQPRFCFVPTVSSLAVNNPQQNLFTPICSNIPCLQPASITNSFAPQVNQVHISYTQPSADWILNNQPINSTCFQTCSNNIGPDAFCTSQIYSIPNLPIGASVVWSVTNINPANSLSFQVNANNSITLTKVAIGQATLTATLTGACTSTPIIITKNILYGGQYSGYFTTNLNSTPVPILLGGSSHTLYPRRGQLVTVNIQLTNLQNITNLTWYTNNFYSGSGSTYSLSGTASIYSYSNTPLSTYLIANSPCGDIGGGYTFNLQTLTARQTNNGDTTINIYTATPNPVSDVLNVSLSEAVKENKNLLVGDYLIKISELNTLLPLKQIHVKKTGKNFQINMAGLKAGYYAIEITDGENKQVLKIFKL
jgi:Secretion system C-terminal sorting domain